METLKPFYEEISKEKTLLIKKITENAYEKLQIMLQEENRNNSFDTFFTLCYINGEIVLLKIFSFNNINITLTLYNKYGGKIAYIECKKDNFKHEISHILRNCKEEIKLSDSTTTKEIQLSDVIMKKKESIDKIVNTAHQKVLSFYKIDCEYNDVGFFLCYIFNKSITFHIKHIEDYTFNISFYREGIEFRETLFQFDIFDKISINLDELKKAIRNMLNSYNKISYNFEI